ncbi:hypothetical protein [Pseudomonas sp. NFX15]|uniref:TRAFAC clade GTPase domain-containing protein n=1 Tax=Pseudomonas sp. NFX15 TaxID=2816958 RepID=UPI003B8B7C19
MAMIDSTTSSATSIVLLGESQVGKSHYGAQLLGRLNSGNCLLRMRGAATNLSAFEEVAHKLNQGVSAAHTPAVTYNESSWPVEDAGGRPVDLMWPDYGGEQIRRLIDERRIPPLWRERLRSAQGWMLMLRLHQVSFEDDPFSRPLAELRTTPAQDAGPVKHSSQARIVELLQMLLYIRGVGTVTPITEPPLMVMLSFWDELSDVGKQTPPQILEKSLPLVASFISSNWHPERFQIVGVSPLGRALSVSDPDESYVNEGPEQHGYVVLPDGVKSSDLTLPIVNLIAMAD